MHISAVVAALPQPLPDALRHVAALGFTHVDLLGMVERPAADLEALADTGLLVSGVALGQGLQVGEALDVLAISHRRAALEAMKRQVADAALLGAGHAFVPGCRDDGHQGREVYEEACRLLAEFSACRMVRLCVDSLAWVERI